MANEKKHQFYRYGVELGNNELIFDPDSSLARPGNPRNGLTRINSESRTLEFFLDGWVSLSNKSAEMQETPNGNFTAIAGNSYPLDSSTGTIALPDNARPGDTVIVIDGAGTFPVAPVTVTRNGKRIAGKDADYLLEREFDLVTFSYISDLYGWSVDHVIPSKVKVTERFSSVKKTINVTAQTTVETNCLTVIDLQPHQTAVLKLPAGVHGDEIHLQAVKETGKGSVPAAIVNVISGNTLNGAVNGSLCLDGQQSWIKLKFIDGWKVIGQSKRTALVVNKSLDDEQFKSSGKFYIAGPTGGLPAGLPDNIPLLLNVEEGRAFSGTNTVTEAFQTLFAPSVSRRWERFRNNSWLQCSPLNTVYASESTDIVSNTHVVSETELAITLSLQGIFVDGDVLKVTTAVTGSTVSISNISLNGSPNGTVKVTGENRTVAFKYDVKSSSWFKELDTNPNGKVSEVLEDISVDDFLSISKGKFYLQNAEGDLPRQVTVGDNELFLDITSREDYVEGIADRGVTGRFTLYDTRSGNQWERRMLAVDNFTPWRLVNASDLVNIQSETTFDVPFSSENLTLVNRSLNDIEFNFSTHIDNAKPGDKILIRNLSDTVITVGSIDVYDVDYEKQDLPNTITGKGDISTYLDEDKNLIILSSIRR